jgi:ribosome maturation factor RimP
VLSGQGQGPWKPDGVPPTVLYCEVVGAGGFLTVGRLPTFCFSGVGITPRAEELERVREAAARVARSHGLEIFDVQLRREPIGMVLRVVIDRPDPGGVEAVEDSVGIAECQRVSQDLSAILDVEDEFGEGDLREKYTLEVSSPGLDRPLRHAADYRRFAGRLAKIVTTEPIARQSAFAGRIAGLDDGAVVLEEGRRTHRVPLDKIKRAHLDVEF